VKFRLTVRGLTVAAIVLTAVVVLLGVALAATSTPQFCSSCKSHKPYVAELKKSAHAGINCEQCHTKPGPLFFLTSKLEALQQPIHQLTGSYEKPILGTVLNQSCRRCHSNEELFKTQVTKDGIKVQHKHLIQAGFLCIRCHATQAHGSAIPAGSRTSPSMDQCLLCHNNAYKDAQGQVATARCDLCHATPPEGSKPATHKDAKWAKDHGSVGILSTCSACHQQKKDCVACHNGVAMPHAATWITQHGDDVNARGRKNCLLCHTKQYCSTCHKVPMPHPAGFISDHPKAAAQNGTQTCFSCHSVANCQACHEAHQLGSPAAHQLFKGIKYTPSATPTAIQGP
jgi:nitrate/TMAO reductase-like tetraheme cytochrome c subunit